MIAITLCPKGPKGWPGDGLGSFCWPAPLPHPLGESGIGKAKGESCVFTGGRMSSEDDRIRRLYTYSIRVGYRIPSRGSPGLSGRNGGLLSQRVFVDWSVVDLRGICGRIVCGNSEHCLVADCIGIALQLAYRIQSAMQQSLCTNEAIVLQSPHILYRPPYIMYIISISTCVCMYVCVCGCLCMCVCMCVCVCKLCACIGGWIHFYTYPCITCP